MRKGGHVYITTTKNNALFYIGVTSNLLVRDYQHKKGIFEKSYTKRYRIHRLVYYEFYDRIEDAIRREKQLKGWTRRKKINLIKILNPEFTELSLLDD